MKPVYDGYCFSQESEHTVFNSSMCLYYLKKVQQKQKFLSPEDYLDPASDQDGSKLQQLFDIAEDGLTDEVIKNYLESKLFVLNKLVENINLSKKSKFNWDQLLSMLYYLGYLTIDREASDSSFLALKIPNLFMSKLFAQCIADIRLKTNTVISCSTAQIARPWLDRTQETGTAVIASAKNATGHYETFSSFTTSGCSSILCSSCWSAVPQKVLRAFSRC